MISTIGHMKRSHPDQRPSLQIVGAGLTFASAALVGALVAHIMGSSGFEWGPVFVLAMVLAPGVYILTLCWPSVAAAIIFGLSFIHPALIPPIFELADVTVRASDAFMIALVLGLAMRWFLRRLVMGPDLLRIFAPTALFVGAVGLSLVAVAAYTPSMLAVSFISYLRLCVTFLFGVTVCLSIRKKRELMLFNWVLVALTVGNLAVAVSQAYRESELNVLTSGRFEGLLGQNALGLASGLLVLLGVLNTTRSDAKPPGVVIILAGALGLLLTKSASSMFATAAAVATYIVLYLRAWQQSKRRTRGGPKRIVLYVAAGVLASLAIYFLRPHDIAGLMELSGGSFAHRLMLAYSGILIFLAHPVLGVGWQASTAPEHIGAPESDAWLAARFSDVPMHYFPMYTPTSVHNMYVQILAEVGVVGATLFLVALYLTGRRIISLLRSMRAGSTYLAWARFYAAGLVFLLVWWNTNPLYGGQLETVVAFAFLGMLGSLARLDRGRFAATV